jgi:transcriptional repressor NrdR
VPSSVVGAAVLAQMQKIDEVGYLRYASVYKDFQAAGDFERELGLLLEKTEPAKRRKG